MFTPEAETGLKGIMEYAEMQDLKDMVYGLTGLRSRATSKMPRRELVNIILTKAKSPGQILRFRCLVKPFIASYLKEVGACISQTHKKGDLIQKCLAMWGVKEDPPEEEDDIKKEMDRLKRKLQRDIKEREEEYEVSLKNMKDELDKDLVEMNQQYEEDLTCLKGRLKKIKRDPIHLVA